MWATFKTYVIGGITEVDIRYQEVYPNLQERSGPQEKMIPKPYICIHVRCKTIPRNDTKTIPISDPFAVFDASHRYLAKVPPRRSCFPFKNHLGQVHRSSQKFPLEWPGRTALEIKRVIFVEAILQRIRPLPYRTMTKEPYFHIGIISLVQTLKNDRVHKKNRYPTLNVLSVY